MQVEKCVVQYLGSPYPTQHPGGALPYNIQPLKDTRWPAQLQTHRMVDRPAMATRGRSS